MDRKEYDHKVQKFLMDYLNLVDVIKLNVKAQLQQLQKVKDSVN